MDYRVFMTGEAEEDLDRFIYYLLFEKGNEQDWVIMEQQVIHSLQVSVWQYLY